MASLVTGVWHVPALECIHQLARRLEAAPHKQRLLAHHGERIFEQPGLVFNWGRRRHWWWAVCRRALRAGAELLLLLLRRLQAPPPCPAPRQAGRPNAQGCNGFAGCVIVDSQFKSPEPNIFNTWVDLISIIIH